MVIPTLKLYDPELYICPNTMSECVWRKMHRTYLNPAPDMDLAVAIKGDRGAEMTFSVLQLPPITFYIFIGLRLLIYTYTIESV